MGGDKVERGDDAADHAPRPKTQDNNKPVDKKQDAVNYDGKREALEVDEVSAGNDEGAN